MEKILIYILQAGTLENNGVNYVNLGAYTSRGKATKEKRRRRASNQTNYEAQYDRIDVLELKG